jgi:DNA polymerase-1
MLLQVHDELVFEAPEAEAGRLIAVAKQVMEGAARAGGGALRAPDGRGNWDEAH